MKKVLISLVLLSLVCVMISSIHADPFIDHVFEVNYGDYAGYGQEDFPEIVLGPPRGAGEMGGSLDVLSLGDGGSIILEFIDNIALNGPGPDLIVFENAFYVNCDPMITFCEVAFVEVSQNGDDFFRFPNDYNPEGIPINNPANWVGFAGVYPVYSHPDNGIDPTNPETAGGDLFDLDDVGLDWVKYVRIIDTNEPPNAEFDDDGDEIYDYGWITEGKSGFDLDAIAAVYSDELFTPTPTPTSSPTQTPNPDNFSVNLMLSQTIFYPNDHFQLNLEVHSFINNSVTGYIMIILDVFGECYFWPSWSQSIDGLLLFLHPGIYEQIILNFNWPEVNSQASDLIFWGALFNQEGMLMSNIEKEEFGYG
ncbi:hypothetical protein K8T06_17380 [bacterium]|nr:hypothetical protein [bacterium]